VNHIVSDYVNRANLTPTNLFQSENQPSSSHSFKYKATAPVLPVVAS
jgi:hypothetical protein